MTPDQAVRLLADGLMVWGVAKIYNEITGEKMNIPKLVSGYPCDYCNKFDFKNELKLYNNKLACSECIGIFSKYDSIAEYKTENRLPYKSSQNESLSSFVIGMIFFVGLGLITGMILALSGV